MNAAEVVITSVLTTLVTIALSSAVARLARLWRDRKIAFTLRQGMGSTWRLRNITRRKIYLLEIMVFTVNDVSRQSEEGSASRQHGDVEPGAEIYLSDLRPGDTLGMAWSTVPRYDMKHLRTAEVRLREGEHEYSVELGSLTYGWGWGPH